VCVLCDCREDLRIGNGARARTHTPRSQTLLSGTRYTRCHAGRPALSIQVPVERGRRRHSDPIHSCSSFPSWGDHNSQASSKLMPDVARRKLSPTSHTLMRAVVPRALAARCRAASRVTNSQPNDQRATGRRPTPE
jgi:hypothetical protein